MLTEKTKVPIGLAVGVIGAVACWVTAVNVQMYCNTRASELQTMSQERTNAALQDIEKQVAVLSVKVQDLTDRLRRSHGR